jgi:D-3-phosphoglycerate dehydrogenase
MTAVLLSAPYLIPVVDRFRPLFETRGIRLLVPEVRERLEESTLLGFAGQFDGAICGDDAFTARVLEACSPRLKVISKWGTGIDSIDADACSRLGIRLFRTVDAFTQPVADSVLGYMLVFARRQPWMDSDMKACRWNKILGRALGECTLGIVGVGNIGKAVARRARGFGMRILGNDIVSIGADFIAETGIEMTTLESLLAASDFVSINCDLNPTSRHLIDSRALSHIKPEAILINTARGAIVDQGALIEALQEHRLAGAALDVFEIEPLPADSPLRGLQNVMLAPHNSNSSPAAYEAVHANTIRNLFLGLGIAEGDYDVA